MHRRGFTLIEMLVVVAIIGVLVGLMVPAMMRLREQARQRKAGAERLVLQNAIKAYFSEYDEWPMPDKDVEAARRADMDDPSTKVIYTYSEDNQDVVKVLRPVSNPRNPKGMHFLEEDNFSRRDEDGVVVATGPLRDPWGKPYTIKIDIRYPGTRRLNGSAGMITGGVSVQ